MMDTTTRVTIKGVASQGSASALPAEKKRDNKKTRQEDAAPIFRERLFSEFGFYINL